MKAAYMQASPEGKGYNDKKKQSYKQYAITLKFSQLQLIKEYRTSVKLQRYINSQKYVYVNGYMVLCSSECLEIINGELKIREAVLNRLSDYCIHSLVTVYEPYEYSSIRSLIKPHLETHVSGRFSAEIKEAKKSSEIILENLLGGNNTIPPINDFFELLKYYMKEKNITVECLAEQLEISTKTVSRWRNGEKKPTLPQVIALCIAFKLSPNQGFDLVRKAGYYLGFNMVDEYYSSFIVLARSITISNANEILRMSGERTLTLDDLED